MTPKRATKAEKRKLRDKFLTDTFRTHTMTKFIGAIIRADNVNGALPLGMAILQQRGERAKSRGLQTIRVPGPVTTVYEKPCERVLFDPVRDANPFFHLMESLWVLSGGNRVALPAYFLKNIAQYSDNGFTFHGAYGYRLRHAFHFDQIESACGALMAKPDSRQVVMSIWHPALDMLTDTKDMPCNDMVMADITNGALNITVCNRSNDAVWGAYGANAVQFSMLQEYMAAAIGVDVGHYAQQSNNFHVYTDNKFWGSYLQGEYEHGHVHNPYSLRQVTPYPLATSQVEASRVYADCIKLDTAANDERSLTENQNYQSKYFINVVVPVIYAYDMYKRGEYGAAIKLLESGCAAEDWKRAMIEWVERRADRKAAQ